MLKQLYMVYDLVAETVLGGIIQETADAPAIRAFHDALGASESLLAQHPKDFNLLLIGSITSDGTVITPNQPTIVATGAAWVANKESTL